MPSAGALPAPFITPIHRECHGVQLPVNKIDVSTLIELSSDTPNVKLYFTTNGSKPLPFQRKIGGKELTFKYFAPFTLKPGKRTLKAVAVSRDGLLESAIVSKDFHVADLTAAGVPDASAFDISSIGSSSSSSKSTSSNSSRSSSSSSKSSSSTLKSFLDDSSDKEFNLKPGKVKGAYRKKSKSPQRKKGILSQSPLRKSGARTRSPLRKSGMQPHVPLREAWTTSFYQDPAATGASNENMYPPLPDGPFNPTNYSGTQINVFGGPGVWPGMNADGNCITFGQGPPSPQYPVQYGFLTEQMIRGLKQKEEKPKKEKKHEGVTLGDIRKLMKENRPKTPPPPAIEYKPVWKDPPLNPVSPGNEDWQGNILHVFAHMLDLARSKAAFKKSIGEYKMGKILESKVEDEGDGYCIRLVLAKPGTQRGEKKKPKKAPPKEAPKSKPPVKPEPKPAADPPKPKPKPQKKADPYYEKEIENIPCEGTLKPYEPFNAEADAQTLNTAMKGIGTDEDALINVLAYRASPQRAEIVKAYKTMFGKDLAEDIKGDTSGNFCEALKGLLHKPAEFDAHMLRNAIKGLGTDEDVLIEILCTRSNAQIQEIKKVYQEKFGKDLEKDITGDTSGNFKRLMVSLVQANRSDSKDVDRNMAHQDAKALYQAGEQKWGTDESQFNKVLASRSFPQLRAMFEEYKKISKKDMEEVLKSEFSGDILSGLKTIVRCVKNRFDHFAQQLQKTMSGLGTDDSTLIRIIISRCEIDLVDIKKAFQEKEGKTLEQLITDETSGDYQRLLLALATGGPPPKPKSGKAFVEDVKLKTDQELDEDVKLENEPKQEDPTLVPFEGFNAEADCEVLRKAMKGFGTDEAAIISVLSKRSQEQRQKIALTYKTQFGKDLGKELSSELSGNFKTLCVEMLLGPAEFDAKQLNKAIKGLGTDEQVLVEIICSRTNDQLNKIKETYKTTYNKELEADVAGDTSGDFKRLLIGCLQANRPEGTEFDRNKAKQDAQELYSAGEKKWGTDESKFHTILVSRSYAQLRATFQEYAKVANKDIEDSIRSEMSGDLKNGMLSIVQVIRGKSNYFAKTLHKAMKGLGTDDDTLVRIVASRCEVDMVQIKEEFQKEFKQSLGMFIADDTSGDYRKMLLALIGDEGAKK
ncbi:Annexin [Plakobranchus ocellatus]|uniref:Annexin n=1 Tax=Plakobranchus ocellatus TaxID=259542 RepID=A0AAV3Z534_9GAST|nr:Annexin [Plakobranchus ocellatus]